MKSNCAIEIAQLVGRQKPTREVGLYILLERAQYVEIYTS